MIIDGVVDSYRTGIGTGNSGLIHTVNPTPFAACTITEMTADTSVHVNELRTMYRVQFTYVNQHYLSPVIHIQFMDANNFMEVDSTCYDLASVPTGTTCAGYNTGGPPTYSRY